MNQYNPSAVALSDGGFAIAWESWSVGIDSQQDGTYLQQYNANGSINGPEVKLSEQTVYSDIAVFSDGSFIKIVNSREDDRVYVQYFNADGSVNGDEFQISSYQNQYTPNVAILPDDGFVITFVQDDGSGTGIYYEHYYGVEISAVSPTWQLNRYTDYNQNDPAVASLNNGNFVVAWVSEQEIYANQFTCNKPVADWRRI